MKKLGIIGGGIILSAALMVSSAGVALASGSEAAPAVVAAAQEGQEYKGIFGSVTGIIDSTEDDVNNPESITLDTKSLHEVEVLLDGDTIYKVPGKEDASVDDIVNGSRLAILTDDSNTAIRVMVVPDGAIHRHMNGVVVATQEKTMTMMNNNGETWQVNLPDGVQGGAVGDFISVAVRNSAGEGPYEASGLQTAASVQTRLQAQINELAGQGSGTQAEVQNRERAMERLGVLCEGLAERHMQVLNNVLEEAPEGAKEAIQAAIQNAQQAMEQVQNTIQGLNAGTGGQNFN